jgi:UDP-N-acetylglucosamine 2-epimerase
LLCLTLRDNSERSETITIVTNEVIGTDPKKLPPTLTLLMAGQWEKARFLRNGAAERRGGSSRIWKDYWKERKAISTRQSEPAIDDNLAE